jgi:uncharacterized protein (TIGR00369 family)
MDAEAFRQLIEELIPFNKFLGIKCAAIGEGYVRTELPWRDEFIGDPIRPAMHGGVISTMADVAGGLAVWSGLMDPHARVSTIDLRVDYLRPGKLATLVAEGQVVRTGSRVAVVDVKLYHPDDANHVIATGKGVYNIKAGKAPSPRSR